MIRYLFFNKQIHKFHSVTTENLESRRDKKIIEAEFPLKHFPIGWSGRILSDMVTKASEKRANIILFDDHFASEGRNPTDKSMTCTKFSLSKRDLASVLKTIGCLEEVKKNTEFWGEIRPCDSILIDPPHKIRKLLGNSYYGTFSALVQEFIDRKKENAETIETLLLGTQIRVANNGYDYYYLDVRNSLKGYSYKNNCILFVNEPAIDIDNAPVYSSKYIQEVYDTKFAMPEITLDEALSFIESYNNSDSDTRKVLLTTLINLDWRNTMPYIIHILNKCRIRQDQSVLNKFVALGRTGMSWGIGDPGNIVTWCVQNSIPVPEDFYQKVVRRYELKQVYKQVRYNLPPEYRARFVDEFINEIDLIKDLIEKDEVY